MSEQPRSDPRVGMTVRHQRYVPYSHAHYGGNLVDGAYVLGLFGDVATELAIRTDADEGLFASYSEVQFLAHGLSAAPIPGVGSRPRGCSTSRSSSSPLPGRSLSRRGADGRAVRLGTR